MRRNAAMLIGTDREVDMAPCGQLRKDAARYLNEDGAPRVCWGKLVHGSWRVSGLSAFALIVVACASLALPATAATASTAPPTAPAPKVAAAAASGSNAWFNSDSCTSRAFCMAVGGYGRSGNLPALSEMLTGGNWVAEPVPRPLHGGNMDANEVSCASPASCLFVGSHWAGKRGYTFNLAEAWNGSSWRIVATARQAGTRYSYLDDVACPTNRFCLAVGAAGTSQKVYHSTAYTWDNRATWRRISAPAPGGARNSELNGLACFNSKNCMAVGNYTSASGRNLAFAARWHDGRWTLMTTPAIPKQRYAEFQGVSCPTATRCVAVGDTVDNTRAQYYHAFAETWSGGKWQVSTLGRSASFFFGVSCPARNRCLAAGGAYPSLRGSFERPLIEAWNGATWAKQHAVGTPSPNVGDQTQHVSCVARTECEVVGFSYDPHSSRAGDRTLAEKWNGQRWTLQTTPNP
jgi:hypothetical protein